MTAPTILIVEDDRDIRETLCFLLEINGYAVLTAENGRVGLDLLEVHEPPCLIFLDLMMPVMDGRQFLEAIRSRPGSILATIPVTIVSGMADGALQMELDSRLGCTIVRKPPDVDLLLDLARRYCGDEACGSQAARLP